MINLLLFGFKGSGKTHFGKLLSIEMKKPFIDTDDLIVELYKKEKGKEHTLRYIYKHLGHENFRLLEKKALCLLKNIKGAIIALGGGAVLDPENVALLEKIGSLIYLKTPIETLKLRNFKEEMPAFFDEKNPEESFYQLIHERIPIYESIKARVIDTTYLDEAGVIAAFKSILLLEEPPNGL